MKIRRIHVYLASVLLAFGFIVSYSIQFTKQTMSSTLPYSDDQWEKKQELQEKIIEEQGQIQELEAQLQSIKHKVSEFETKMGDRQAEGKELLKELEEVRMWVGLVPVTGPGVSVVLNDSKEVPELGNVNDFIVHEENIRQVVNELFASGAEGISINGQRLTTISSIRCVGPTVLVNEVKVVPPFDITAIGNPDTLSTALSMPQGVLQNLKDFTNIEIKLEKKENLKLPAFTGDTQKLVVKKGDL